MSNKYQFNSEKYIVLIVAVVALIAIIVMLNGVTLNYGDLSGQATSLISIKKINKMETMDTDEIAATELNVQIESMESMDEDELTATELNAQLESMEAMDGDEVAATQRFMR